MFLANGTLLQEGKYKIEQVLGQGGFGITYLAIQCDLERKVAIKEFFMKEFCARSCGETTITTNTTGSFDLYEKLRAKFKKEARNIATLNHPNIIKVFDVFEENNTVYYVMSYCEGGSLADRIAQTGYLSEGNSTRYILQVASAVGHMHSCQINHFDIKPGNIMLTHDDNAVLIDFGLSKQYDHEGYQTSTTPIGISVGYAPLEQHDGNLEIFSPESDIYSLGATFFKMLTGKTPPSAAAILKDGVPVEELICKGVSRSAIDAITKAMEPKIQNRPHNIKEFRKTLEKKRNYSLGMFGGFMFIALCIILTWNTFNNHKNGEPIPINTDSIGNGMGSDTISEVTSDDQVAKQYVPVAKLVAYYAKESFDNYKKGQLIVDSNDPINRIIEHSPSMWKYEGDDTGVYYYSLIPKSKVERKEYEMCELPISEVIDGATFVSEEGARAKIFRAKRNGFKYFSRDSLEDRDATIKYTHCLVLSIQYQDWIFEDPLDEELGNIQLYFDNTDLYDIGGSTEDNCRHRNHKIGFHEEQWINSEEYKDGISAYNSRGELLTDQIPNFYVGSYISIAFIPTENALYIDGELYYREE